MGARVVLGKAETMDSLKLLMKLAPLPEPLSATTSTSCTWRGSNWSAICATVVPQARPMTVPGVTSELT
jgi:hypothetical protein